MRKPLVLLTLMMMLIVGVISTLAQDDMPGTIADIVVASASADEAEFTTLLAAVSAADEAVLTALSDEEAELTVFAPTDEAFAALIEALGEDAFNDILEDQEALTNILLYHVVGGAVMAESVVELDGEQVDTLLEDYFVNVMVDEDGNVFINDAQVVVVDVEAANGVIHVIDTVIVPAEENMTPSIADLVVEAASMEEDGEFTILLTAVSAADPSVLEALSDDAAELTVFAPTDEAFGALIEALGEDAFNGIVADTEALTNILLYHVVAGVAMAEDVVELDGASVDTLLEGRSLAISITDEGVFLNETVQVVVTDVEASNGVIHIIDTVLVPAE